MPPAIRFGHAGHRRADRPRGNPRLLLLAGRHRAELAPRRPGRCPVILDNADQSGIRQHVTPIIHHRPEIARHRSGEP
jgi:hypothetical protein